MSTLTVAELAAGPHATRSGAERARREAHLRLIQGWVLPLDFDPTCARAYATIYRATQAFGRKARGTRAVDLMIAATALAHDLALYTLNARDLRGLEGLVEVVDLAQ